MTTLHLFFLFFLDVDVGLHNNTTSETRLIKMSNTAIDFVWHCQYKKIERIYIFFHKMLADIIMSNNVTDHTQPDNAIVVTFCCLDTVP